MDGVNSNISKNNNNNRRRSAVGRPRKACNICQTQKIRCTEERPSCKRCVRLQHNCTYNGSDPPAERGSGRGRGRKPSPLQPLDDKRNNAAIPVESQQPVIHAQQRQPPPQPRAPPQLLSPDSRVTNASLFLGVSDSVLLEIVDIYFDHVYNSHLLLHKRSFLTSVLEGRACAHVLLSVCAWGAKYYEDADGAAALKDGGFMLDWAERSGMLAFQNVEKMVHENIVTFLNLALFWHSMGSWRRSYLHKGTAFLLPDLLGLGPKALQGANSLEAEIRRRQFWACYIMHAHTAEKSSHFDAKGNVLTLPLPWPDEDFDDGVCRRPQVSLSSDEGDESIYGALIRATTFWSSVTVLLKSSDASLHVRVPAILALDEKLQQWWQTAVPASLKLTPENVGSVPRRAILRVLHLNTLYHQCLCSLHASLVPLFSGVPGDGWGAVRQISAQVALEHAAQLSAVIAALLATTTRTSLVPMFMGYAAYCGCAVQIPFMWCANPDVRERAQANVRTNTKLLQMMGVDWKFASMLNAYVHYLYTMHSKPAIILDDEPKNISRDKLSCFNCQVANTRASIYEYIHMLRNDEGGYGSPDDEDDNDDESGGGVVVTTASKAVHESHNNMPSIYVGVPDINNNTDNNFKNNDNPDPQQQQQQQQQAANYLSAAGGGSSGGGMLNLNLMNPFDTESFGMSLDEGMLDFQPLLQQAAAGVFDFNNDMTLMPWDLHGT